LPLVVVDSEGEKEKEKGRKRVGVFASVKLVPLTRNDSFRKERGGKKTIKREGKRGRGTTAAMHAPYYL